MPQREDRVRSFEAQHVADRGALDVRVAAHRCTCRSRPRISDLHELAALLHRAVPGELPLRHGPRLLWRVPAGQRVVRRDVPRDLGRDAQANASPAHLRKRHRAAPRSGLSVMRVLARADVVDGTREVPIPFERVHRQIEMGVQDQHRLQATTSASSRTHPSAVTDRMVSRRVHVATVSATVMLKYSFTSQKPPSLT